MHPAIVDRIIIEDKTILIEDDGLADISEIHWGEEIKNIIEDEEKYYDMSNKSRY